MLWKLLLSLASIFSGSVNRQPAGDQEIALPFAITDHGPQTLQEMAEAHEALYAENDMILPADFKLTAGARNTKYRWPGYPGKAEVPYVIDSSLSSQKALIERAMNQYNTLTCIKFVPRTSQRDYVKLIKGLGCKSPVGRHGGEQKLSLGRGCHYVGTVVHELGHALGLFHEHQRSDRDTYLTVYDRNVTSGQGPNFAKVPTSDELLLTGFNYNSIMIYGNYAFSKQPGKLMTIVAKNGRTLLDPFNKPGMDNTDIDQVRKLYRC